MNCVIDETKICDSCGECDRCDIDPQKLCDNCCKCITADDYLEYKLTDLQAACAEDEEENTAIFDEEYDEDADEEELGSEEIEDIIIDGALLREWEEKLSESENVKILSGVAAGKGRRKKTSR